MHKPGLVCTTKTFDWSAQKFMMVWYKLCFNSWIQAGASYLIQAPRGCASTSSKGKSVESPKEAWRRKSHQVFAFQGPLRFLPRHMKIVFSITPTLQWQCLQDRITSIYVIWIHLISVNSCYFFSSLCFCFFSPILSDRTSTLHKSCQLDLKWFYSASRPIDLHDRSSTECYEFHVGLMSVSVLSGWCSITL